MAIALEGVTRAALCDTHERPIRPLTVENGEIRFDARPYGLFTIRAWFDKEGDGK